MTNLRSALATGAVSIMAILKTCHGFYVPGVRPHEFLPGEEVPMKVNAMTSIHTQVSLLLSVMIDRLMTTMACFDYYVFVHTPTH